MIRTLFRWLLLLALLSAICGPGMAAAEEGQIYTIKKGDTLWDLSKRFIDDPYYWPNVWAKNPAITNPHLIFPGQKIRILDGRLEIIPAYTEGESAAQPDQAPTITGLATKAAADELIQIRTSSKGNGFILTDEQSLGILADTTDNRVLISKNDLVFVKMTDPTDVTVGDTYGLYERGDKVIHPVTGEPIGTMMQNLGALQVTEINGGTVTAKIIIAFREIERGAELFEYVPVQRDITLQRAETPAPGVIVAGRDERNTMSTNDVIFIDRGSNDGVKTGNLFYISRPRQVSKELFKQAGDLVLPDEVLGAAITVDTRPTTATAVIIKSVKEAFPGDQTEMVTD